MPIKDVARINFGRKNSSKYKYCNSAKCFEQKLYAIFNQSTQRGILFQKHKQKCRYDEINFNIVKRFFETLHIICCMLHVSLCNTIVF